jgi:hypothetical protein
MKLEHHSAPGKIRKKKGALSRVLHWVTTPHPMCLSMNRLSLLPKRYSGYDRSSRDVLKGKGVAVPVDRERNRRIDRDEEARIVAVLERKLSAATSDDERAEFEGMILMFQLGLETCMRMREFYTTTVDQVRLDCRSIFLSRSKSATFSDSTRPTGGRF